MRTRWFICHSFIGGMKLFQGARDMEHGNARSSSPRIGPEALEPRNPKTTKTASTSPESAPRVLEYLRTLFGHRREIRRSPTIVLVTWLPFVSWPPLLEWDFGDPKAPRRGHPFPFHIPP